MLLVWHLTPELNSLSSKYIQRVELTAQPNYCFWVQAGYPYAGEVPPARLRPGKY